MQVRIRNLAQTVLETATIPVGGGSVPALNSYTFASQVAGTYYLEAFNPSSCGVSYAFQCYDDDNDGVCNGSDLCANTPTGEGVNNDGCSCSQVTVDDGDVCTLDECLNGNVTNTFQDADNDLTCDANDGCPNDPNKIAPGQCGCGVADTDSDGDLTADCNDGCPNDPNKIAPGICGCGVADTDSDGDLTADCNDGCPNDPNKIAPGICGCGVADTDSDGDLTADCNDGCPNDPNKIAPGNCGCGNPEPGATCDDGNANTTGDVIQANCICEGTPIGATDCNGIVGGPAQPGTPCDDLNACTVNDVYTGAYPNCGCAGTPVDPDDGDPCTLDSCDPFTGVSHIFQDADGDLTCDANDGCPNDPNKIAPGICGCGVADTDSDGDLTADCNDGCPNDPNKVAPGNCGCGNPEPGATCDDGNANTTGDVIQANCTCEGTPIGGCTNNLILEFQNDANPALVTWTVLDVTGTTTVDSGTDIFPANSIGTQAICLPDGCYQLRVTDNAGDGLLGYTLSETGANGQRIIDNAQNMITGVSQIANGEAFCVPIGDDRLIYGNCDKLDWVTNKFIVAAENAAVTAAYATPSLRSSSGYLFWFFDPNGAYSFRRFRKHSESDGYGTGALRANHFRINSWVNTPSSPHLPDGMLLNVRIMGRVNWSWTTWGPACQFKMDAALAACPSVNLRDNPNLTEYSCGVNRVFGGSNNWTNRVTATQPQPVPSVSSSLVRFQFRFRIPSENICIVRPPQTSPRLYMNWSAASGPQLECSRQYEVDVRVSLDGGATWCFGAATPSCVAPVTPWGTVCMVNITSSTNCPGELQEGSSNLATQDGNLTMYPNPNRGDQLYINLSAVDADVNTVSVDIYDLTGKRISARTIAVQDGFLNTVMDLNGEIAGGLYMVNITAGDKTYTERLVIQP
jgi:hypothetical protein